MFAYALIKQKRDFMYLHIFHLHIIDLCLYLPLYLYIILLKFAYHMFYLLIVLFLIF